MAKVQSKPGKLISTAAAAERLSVHPNTIRSFLAENRLKGYKVGRSIRLDATEVEDFIKEVATGG